MVRFRSMGGRIGKASFGVSCLFVASMVEAQSTWTGNGSTNQWSTATNWSPSGPPVSGSSLQVTFNNSNRLQNSQDIQTPPLTLNRLTFATGAGAFVISGPGKLRYDGTAPRLIQQTGNRQTVATDVALLNTSLSVEGAGAGDVALSGRVLPDSAASGGGLVKNGGFTLELAGVGANTYSGNTIVNAGTLMLNKSASVSAVGPGELVVGDGVGNDRVYVVADEQIPDSATVTLGAGSNMFELGTGRRETIRQLRSGGSSGGIVKLGANSRLITGGRLAERFNGQFQGPSTAVVERNGQTASGLDNTLVLGGSSPDFGGTLLIRSGGAALVPGRQLGKASAPVSLTVEEGGWLMGGGTMYVRRNASNLPANFKYGSTLRLQDVSQGARVLNLIGDLLLEPGSSLRVELGGSQPGDGVGVHGQLRITGQITLNGSRLDFVSPVAPVVGQPYVIIDNDGTDPVQGTFAKQPEGQVFHWVDGLIWKISYRGGDGNDVTLTTFGTAGGGSQIPTTTTWGLTILALALLSAAKIRFGRQPMAHC